MTGGPVSKINSEDQNSVDFGDRYGYRKGIAGRQSPVTFFGSGFVLDQ
jgi:hypothetical protein